MNKLLHIIATPRGEDSATLQISSVFLEEFKKTHNDWVIEHLDLTKEQLPSLTTKRVDGKYVLLGGKELYGDLKESWQEIIERIEHFQSADGYLLSTPMWNFNIPYFLKHYIDIIVQPRYLFHYTPSGVEGLVKNKKMLVIASRGGDYTTTGPASASDMQEPYLRLIFGFIGIKDIKFIIAQPMDIDIENRKVKLQEAKNHAAEDAKDFFRLNMPRDIPVSNGNLYIAFDKYYRIAEFFFPHVGHESHTSPNPFHFGVWVNGVFSWIDQSWQISMKYLDDTLATDVLLVNADLKIKIAINDIVDFHENVYLKKLVVENLSDEK
ncbi:MAG: NAD(P)H-dependent oxidoreductase, partial [Phycisphaerales bacterium]